MSRFPIGDEAINIYMGRPGDGPEPRLELTYNIGRTEPYQIGTGYGHIAVSVTGLEGNTLVPGQPGNRARIAAL